jgi:hypothetical protein
MTYSAKGPLKPFRALGRHIKSSYKLRKKQLQSLMQRLVKNQLEEGSRAQRFPNPKK